MQLIHNKDYDYDDYDDNVFVDNEVRVEEDRTRGYRFSFSVSKNVDTYNEVCDYN